MGFVVCDGEHFYKQMIYSNLKYFIFDKFVLLFFVDKYFQLLDMLNCEEMVKYFANKEVKIFQLLQNKWMSLKEIVYVLRILYETTIAFQSKKLTLSDVYGHWITTQLHLKQCISKKSYKF